MAYTQTMTIQQFMQRSYKKEDRIIDVVTDHIRRHKVAYKIVGTTLFIFLLSSDLSTVFASTPTGIDLGADKIYKKLVNVGKWVIICKGAIETIKNVADGDFQSAKKNFLGYMIVYAILWALPWGMKQIDTLFSEMET